MPLGIVKFYNQNLNRDNFYGFIVYPSDESYSGRLSRARLDRSVYVPDQGPWCSLKPGHRVEFDIETTDGKEGAVNIRIIDRVLGIVAKTGRKPFGFIQPDGTQGRDEQIFVAFDDVTPDALGRRALPLGTRVSFYVEHGVGGKRLAVDVLNEDTEHAALDPVTHREFGIVHFFDKDRGHIRRPNGDSIIFLAKWIATEGVETIRVGSWLRYGIRSFRYLWRDDLQNFYSHVAVDDVAVCLEESGSRADSQPILPVDYIDPNSIESYFLTVPELPLDPERPEPGRVYSAIERRMTLRAIIEARRTHQKAAQPSL